nr:RNA-directed DNA polymerase, eukaryota [Tanacetum cinerariifolium]
MAASNRSNSDHTQLISKSIFVTNFLDNTSAKDLWEVCNGYGTVIDVFIPNHKSRSGKRFAFVRFIKVGNVDRLVENLCTLWIGRMHLHANVVRYDRPLISSFRPYVAPRPTVKSISRPSANVKDFSFINNLLILLSNEGFQHVRLVYLGGLWVMIELPSIKTKTRFMTHVEIASWFSQLRKAQSDFVSRERIVWIDIEGVPLHAWSRPTFSKIGSRWGEVLELEDNKYDCFAQEEKNVDLSKKVNLEDESDIEGVSEAAFGDQDDPLVQELNQNSLPNEKEISSDPFNLYNLINKRDKGEENTRLDSSLPFPPGFTPADQPTKDQGSPKDNLNQRVGGSILEVIEDMIKVGQCIGFMMEGRSKAKKDWIKELNNKHKVNFLSIQETKSDRISDMDIKSLWGNSKFDCTISESVETVRFLKNLHDINSANARDYMQKAKIQWAIEGNENSKFFHGIINRKRANLAIKGVMADGDWVDDPCRVKEEFRLHFANRFRAPVDTRRVLNAVWGCGENKSPGPDVFSFEFFRKFWDTVGSNFYEAVEWFFDHSSFSRGCNSSFITLIPKNKDYKFVNDYRPISLIGSLYKVVTKILANWLSSVIHGLISDVQTAFLPNRQILDGPFIINELLSWCKHKKQQAMVFKVDIAKAYDSIRWDFLEDVLTAFGFGPKWCSWIRGCLHSSMASVLLNGSPSSEFQFYYGLKQGDPLAPYLFLLVMESHHLSVSRAIEAGIFKGIKIDSTLNLSYLFYADDAVFIGEWSPSNLSGITNMLHCFSLLSGLSINLKKSNLLGVGVRSEYVKDAAVNLGCLTMQTPFKYLGVIVGGNCTTSLAWEDTIGNLKARLSKWKLKTLSVGGSLTLLKSVLGSTPIYNLSIYKAPKSVLHSMESLRRNFFNGSQCNERKITWIKWSTTLTSKKNGGLGISSLYALNRAIKPI